MDNEKRVRVRQHADAIADMLSRSTIDAPVVQTWRAWYELPIGKSVVAILRRNTRPAFGTNPVSVSYVCRFDSQPASRDTLLLTNDYDVLEIVLWLGLDGVESVTWVDQHSGHRLYS